MLRHRAYMVTFVPSMLRCSVAEIKPGARLTKPSVARVRRSISRCWLACVTVNTLMNVTVLSFSDAIFTSTPLIQSKLARGGKIALQMVAPPRCGWAARPRALTTSRQSVQLHVSRDRRFADAKEGTAVRRSTVVVVVARPPCEV